MTVRNQNVKVFRGNTASLVVPITQADGTEYDPTLGAQFRYRVALTSHANDSESLVRKSLGNGITSTPQGTVTILLNAEDTDFDPGIYYHELKVWDGVDVSTAFVGVFVVKKAVGMGDRVIPLQGNVAIDRKVPVRTP